MPVLHALIAGLLLAAAPVDLRHAAAPWAILEYGGADPAGSNHSRIVFLRHTKLGDDYKPLTDPAPAWTVRREDDEQWTIGRRSGEAKTTVRWIDGRTCPKLAEVLERLDRLPAVKPYALNAITKPYIDPPPVHGSGWRLTVFGQAGAAEIGLTLADNAGTVVGAWWIEAAKDLEPCWRAEEPVFP